MSAGCAVGLRKGQLRYVQPQQGRPRARGRAGAATRGNARGAHGVPAQM